MIAGGNGSSLAPREQAALQAQAPVHPDAPDSTTQSLNFAAIWHHRWVALAVFVLFLAGGIVYLTQAQKLYASTARVLVEQRGLRILNESEPYLNDLRIFYFTQCEIMRSTPIVAKVVESQKVREMPTFANADMPVAALQQALSVSVPKDSQVITISFTSPYPQDTPKIVNGIVDSYLDYRNGQRKSSAAEVLKILEKEKERRDAELDQAQRALLEFRRANGMLSFETNGSNIVTQRLAELSRQVTQAEIDMIEADALSSAAQKAGKDSDKLRQLVADNSRISFAELEKGESDLITEVNSRQRAMMELRMQYGPGHQLVQKAQSDLAQMRQDLGEIDGRLAAKYQSAIAQRLEMSKHKLDELKQSFDEQQKAALALNAQSAEFTKLDSDARRLERLCDVIDTRIKELNITEDGDAISASVLEPGHTGMLVFPLASRVLFIAALLGVIVASGVAFLLSIIDKRLRTLSEVRDVVGLQVLGMVPHVEGKHSVGLRGHVVSSDSMSVVAEAYRTLRTMLFFRAGSSGAKTVLVTSPTMGDGKTMTASNLAIAVAQSGNRTLLIDADLRRPMQHKLFDIDNRRGLTNVIAGEISASDAIRASDVPGLDLLTSGPIPTNPAEVLNSDTFRELLTDLSRQYDLVIMDSPPVMPVTDARILGAMCDVTVLVLRAMRTDLRAAKNAKETLFEVGANVAGGMINDAPLRGPFYGRDNYYGRYYGYPQRVAASKPARESLPAPQT
jgi:capsular exopolysaccharide synthesis family protein